MISIASLSAPRACPAVRRGPPIPAVPSANAPAPRPSSKRPALSTAMVAAGLARRAGDAGGGVGEAVVVGMILDADQVQAARVGDGGDPLGDGQAAGVGVDVESELH